MSSAQPKVGETWTLQSCLKHGCPSPFPYDWKKFPVAAVIEVTRIEPYFKEMVECGCMELTRVNPRLHDPAVKGPATA
jgi:hypothetical protein